MTTITFRGTGDSQGVPRVYCDCMVCADAREAGSLNRRYRCALQIEDPLAGSLWIDCGPDWGKQMEAADLRTIQKMLITHAHYDHIGGLPEWYDTCRWTGSVGEAYAPSVVIAEISSRFPWLSGRINFHCFDDPIDWGRWRVMSWRVNHGKNGYAYAFRFDDRESGRAWAYCSDSIGLTEEQQQPLFGLDLLIMGTSFYNEPYPYESRSVYDITEVIDLAERWAPSRTILTHMSHDIDLRRDYGLPAGMELAKPGMAFKL